MSDAVCANDPPKTSALLRRIAAVFYAAAVALALPLWLFFVWYAATWTARLGLAALLGLTVCGFCALWAGRPKHWCSRRGRRALYVGLAASFLALGAIVALAPSGRAGGETLLAEHVFLKEFPSAFPRFAAANIVPEADQVCWGVALARWFDALLGGPKAARLRANTLAAYCELAGDAELRGLGSAMDFCYAPLLGGDPDTGHYVALVPRDRKGREKVLCLVFLHGSGGNFAAYWKVLAPLAREEGVALLFPSFGMGNWQRDGSAASVLAALDDATQRFRLDPENCFVAGLSNGGRGVTRAVALAPERFRGVVLISAVLEEGTIAEGLSQGGWKGTRVLLLHGQDDERVPWDYTFQRMRQLMDGGARMLAVPFPGQDHFLMFAMRENMADTIAKWMKEHTK
ncbi:MAG: hypothetical protein L6R28_05830 [Planctomycetes bacterium]|nr:hypothetical protein [Planctomycetota bacterium]